MKKLFIFATLSLFLASCGNKDNKSTDAIIAANNLEAMKAKRSELQVEISKLDEALSKLDTIKPEALVSVYTIKDTVFSHYIEIQGNVDTKENILIQPETSGVLMTLNVKAGQTVTKGQVLGKIDDAGASQGLAALETQYALDKTTYERQKNLWDQKIGSEIQFLQAKAKMQSSQKAVAQSRAQLAKSTIRAPFSGTIDDVFVERGEVVAPSAQGLMRIVNLGNMYVSTSVPESYIGKLKVGTEVDIDINAINKTVKGKIRQIANSINPTNRTFGIEVAVPNTENLLRPNQVAKLKIIDYTNEASIVVPTNVIQEDANKQKYVYIATQVNGKSGIAKKVIVKTGQSAGNVTEILSGISTDDVVITEGVSNISDGMKVNF